MLTFKLQGIPPHWRRFLVLWFGRSARVPITGSTTILRLPAAHENTTFNASSNSLMPEYMRRRHRACNETITVRCPVADLASVVTNDAPNHEHFDLLTERGIGAAVAARLASSPPTKANRVQSRPGQRMLASGNRAGRCRWSAGLLGDLPPPMPPPQFRRLSIFTLITLISSEDLAVKSSPNISIQTGVANREHVRGHIRTNGIGIVIVADNRRMTHFEIALSSSDCEPTSKCRRTSAIVQEAPQPLPLLWGLSKPRSCLCGFCPALHGVVAVGRPCRQAIQPQTSKASARERFHAMAGEGGRKAIQRRLFAPAAMTVEQEVCVVSAYGCPLHCVVLGGLSIYGGIETVIGWEKILRYSIVSPRKVDIPYVTMYRLSSIFDNTTFVAH
ncbi:hypothetical protein PR048_010251 [Dryococelus australis]|uniref:Uncharacterized protein n=1 Tax=Dryococelus australis TaxID=614101 RepID=A0ABQ9I2C4_9NEOP|nr:hypothetical protein PR048_010251 [Dryococelus australis]